MKRLTIALACVVTGAWMTPQEQRAADTAREPVLRIVEQIKRADYEGDRPALRRHYDELSPFVEDPQLASRVRYWRGFAMWRKALNGFNESVDPGVLEQDLKLAVDEFKAALVNDPAFLDAKAGVISCMGNIMYLHLEDQARMQESITEIRPMVQEARAAAPDHPRLIWVLGPNLWNSPPERGGGQDKAIESYKKALDAWRGETGVVTDPLEPSWGKPELMMSLAWSNLNKAVPDPAAAERYARAALEIVPYWHYVKDILLPQIQNAKAKQN